MLILNLGINYGFIQKKKIYCDFSHLELNISVIYYLFIYLF